jgi:hypothetical protein
VGSVGVVSTVSPLAVSSASGRSLSSDALLNDLDVFGEVHWSTEIVIWDQFFAFRVDATWESGACWSIRTGEAGTPDGVKGILGDLDWMTELS